MPPELQPTLTSVHLPALSEGVDVRRYDTILEPSLKNICVLERKGVFIASVEKNLKSTVLHAVADNIGAHYVTGLVESFNGDYSCNLCLGHHSEFQLEKVRLSAFSQRSKEA